MFLRISRMSVPSVHPDDYQFEIGKAALLRDGTERAALYTGWQAAIARATLGTGS
jgi:transketolase